MRNPSARRIDERVPPFVTQSILHDGKISLISLKCKRFILGNLLGGNDNRGESFSELVFLRVPVPKMCKECSSNSNGQNTCGDTSGFGVWFLLILFFNTSAHVYNAFWSHPSVLPPSSLSSSPSPESPFYLSCFWFLLGDLLGLTRTTHSGVGVELPTRAGVTNSAAVTSLKKRASSPPAAHLS